MGKLGELRHLAHDRSFITAHEARERGIADKYLQRLAARGEIERVGRGVYAVRAFDAVTEHTSLVEACLKVPGGVVCLLSALRFHGLTTQLPHEVWLAVRERAYVPRVDYPPLRVSRFGGASWAYGVEPHAAEGQTVRVYGVAKTVADCFKYRNTVGTDVAIEALTDAWRRRRVTMDALWEAAQVNRVTNVIRPYLEAVQA